MVVLLIGTVWLVLSLLTAALFVAVVRGFRGGAVASGTGEPRHIDVPAPRAAEQPVPQKAGAGR
jgi:hypothetical protein